MDIKVLGPGCPKCDKTAKHVKEALKQTGAEAQVEKVTDMMEIAKFGVMGTPAIVIDGVVKCAGKIPSVDEIQKWLSE